MTPILNVFSGQPEDSLLSDISYQPIRSDRAFELATYLVLRRKCDAQTQFCPTWQFEPEFCSGTPKKKDSFWKRLGTAIVGERRPVAVPGNVQTKLDNGLRVAPMFSGLVLYAGRSESISKQCSFHHSLCRLAAWTT